MTHEGSQLPKRRKARRPPLPTQAPAPAQQAAQEQAPRSALDSTMPSDLDDLLGAAGLDLERSGFPTDALPKILSYLDAMLDENQRINLTAIRQPRQALILHVLDSMQVWRVVEHAPQVVIDLGSGNGFPGIVAAALWPAAKILCVERTKKKALAIQRCCAAVGFDNADVFPIDSAQIPARAPGLRRSVDLVLTRAMASLSEATQLAAPLLARKHALIVHWKAKDLNAKERRQGLEAAKYAQLTAREDFVYQLPDDEGRMRRLVCYERSTRIS